MRVIEVLLSTAGPFLIQIEVEQGDEQLSPEELVVHVLQRLLIHLHAHWSSLQEVAGNSEDNLQLLLCAFISFLPLCWGLLDRGRLHHRFHIVAFVVGRYFFVFAGGPGRWGRGAADAVAVYGLIEESDFLLGGDVVAIGGSAVGKGLGKFFALFF